MNQILSKFRWQKLQSVCTLKIIFQVSLENELQTDEGTNTLVSQHLMFFSIIDRKFYCIKTTNLCVAVSVAANYVSKYIYQ